MLTSATLVAALLPVDALGASQLDRNKTLPALIAAALQDFATTLRLHTSTEPVRAHSLALLWLISALRHTNFLLLDCIPHIGGTRKL